MIVYPQEDSKFVELAALMRWFSFTTNKQVDIRDLGATSLSLIAPRTGKLGCKLFPFASLKLLFFLESTTSYQRRK